MHNRLRLLSLFTGILYLGPLLAGLIGQGWAMVPVFAAIFVLSSVIVRPHLWPRSSGDLSRAEGFVALEALVATQVLLVVGLFAVGRGKGGVLALQPALPYYLPAALSFLSVPLSRLVWGAREVADYAGFDPVLHEVTALPGKAGAAEMVAHLMALGDDVAEEVVQQHLSAIADHVDPVLIRQALGDAMSAGRKALIIHATDPAVSPLLAGTRYPAQAFAAAGRDGGLLTLFARRCVMVLEDEPDLAADCPDVADVARAAQESGDPETRAALNRLAGLIAQSMGRPLEVSLGRDLR